jgi:hypothetical protein
MRPFAAPVEMTFFPTRAERAFSYRVERTPLLH